jgi:hypothetical protein
MMLPARVVAIALAVLAVACGQKGPPLAPLHLVPAAPPNLAAKRVGAQVRLQFDVPSTNANGPGTLTLDRIEVYAATVAAGAVRPSNRELLTTKYRVGTIPIKPPPVEGEAEPTPAEPDDRPAAGERTAFEEPLSGDALVPTFTKTPVVLPGDIATRAATIGAVAIAAAAYGVAAEATAAAMPPPTAAPSHAVRVYAIRGLTRGGRPGPPSTRVEIPLVDPPPTPPAPSPTATETAIVLSWIPLVSMDRLTYNIYKVGGLDPINAAPVAEGRYERAGVQFGTEECFVLRSVHKIGAINLESGSSDPACLTPRDTFPPAAPKGLSLVAGTGLMNLSWDGNKEPDLGGYLVLRGEVPGDTLQPLTPAPIASTSYEDKTVMPGVRYVYVIVAIDKASPANRSAQSARIEETAR